MDLHRYRFRSVWQVPATAAETVAALRRVADYPAWWSQVRSAVRVDDDTYDLVVRSLLPYDLSVRSTRSVDDEDTGVLEARLTGDLDGFSRWRVLGSATTTTTLAFEEEVLARKPLLRRFGFVARPAFVANHALMMRAGQRGLTAYLAGRRSIAQDSVAQDSVGQNSVGQNSTDMKAPRSVKPTRW